MSSHASLEPGARIGKYVLRERIGNGATAHVYEAQHEALGHVVAIKVLRRVMVAKIQGRFDRETRALASIHSRHVPQVHDVGTYGGWVDHETFEEAGGTHFSAIPCLNDSDAAIDMLEALVTRELGGWWAKG